MSFWANVPRIQATWTRPGSEWTPDERDMQVRWLCEIAVLESLILFVRRPRRLDSRATREDAADVVQSYLAERFFRPGGLMERFDPAKSEFRHYFLEYLLYHCGHLNKRERKRLDSEQPFPTVTDDEGEETVADMLDPSVHVDTEVIEKLAQEETRRRLKRALRKLSDRDRTLISFADLQGLSHSEIAAKLGLPLSPEEERRKTLDCIKVTLFRARHRLRRLLILSGDEAFPE